MTEYIYEKSTCCSVGACHVRTAPHPFILQKIFRRKLAKQAVAANAARAFGAPAGYFLENRGGIGARL